MTVRLDSEHDDIGRARKQREDIKTVPSPCRDAKTMQNKHITTTPKEMVAACRRSQWWQGIRHNFTCKEDCGGEYACRDILKQAGIDGVPNDYTRQKIVEKRIWYIGDSMFYAFQWGTVTPNSFHLKLVPLWVHLWDVPLNLRSLEGLGWVARELGNPKETNQYTINLVSLVLSHVKVEMDLTKPLPRTIKLLRHNGQVVIVEVDYPWVPPTCSNCSELGHIRRNCLLPLNDTPPHSGSVPSSSVESTHEIFACQSRSAFDLRYQGSQFTWTNKHHSPFLIDLSFQLPREGTRPFKFFNYLTKHPEFTEKIEDAWLQVGDISIDLSSFDWKLKKFKWDLKQLDKSNFSNIQQRVDAALVSLQYAQTLYLNVTT
ncbi:hypothetical protein N665_0997s0003 [Sinapis alba]|nr:hypothetical protein N665_0997s0003 [Sinapis alba]